MLCYVMLCYVMLCYVMLCYVMLCYVMLHDVIDRVGIAIPPEVECAEVNAWGLRALSEFPVGHMPAYGGGTNGGARLRL